MTEDNVRRPKRRCASRNVHTSARPSAVHYVGYVEEDETPEMIMAKFQELERIQKAVIEVKKDQIDEAVDGNAAEIVDAAAANDAEGHEDAIVATDTTENIDETQALTDEQLLEVFKQTSMFNVKTALQDNAMLMGIDEMLEHQADRYGFEDEISDDDDLLRSFWSDDEDFFNDSGSDGEYGGNKKGKRRGAGSRRTGGGGRAQRNAGGVRARHNIVTAYNPDTQALVRRKVRVSYPDEIVQIRVPNAPIPIPWGRVVKPYLPRELRGIKKYAVAPVPARETPHPAKYLELDSLSSLQPKTLDSLTYQAALINPGWDRDGATGAAALSALAQIPLPKLVPTGFIFIWTPKQHIQAVCKQMTKWGYIYIENLTWVYMASNNAILKLDSEFVRKSHMTLYMFRVADKGRDIELRHQRNPDVTFECLPATFGNNCGPALAPEETFVAVETLLPTGKGQLLELWAPQGVKRPGWTHVVEVGQNES